MIDVQNLTKHYGPVTAIRDVSFSVEPGQIIGFLGPNGAGKSTTMRILSCFMPASGGTARVALRQLVPKPYSIERVETLPAIERFLKTTGNCERERPASCNCASSNSKAPARSS